ncbi:MAG: serine/threonine-protein kinase [bacterium]
MSLPDDDPYGWRTSFEFDQSRPALSTADVWTNEEETVHTARYQKVSLLGQGGMGRVWLGWDTQLRRSVAIKEPLGGAAEASRLMREARLCARLDHAGVVVIFDVYEDGDKPHFVMSLVRGQTLADLLLARTAEQSDLLRHVLAVCEAVGHAHRVGVLHRDLSPRNILIDQDHAARVIDWGLAIAVDDVQQGSPGTPGFMSPEQTRGETVDVRSDVWSLGALLFTVLSGHSPNIGPIAPDVQPELRAIAEKAMAEDPEARYRDAAALGDDLRRWFEGRRIQAYDHTPWRIVRRMVLAYKGPILVALAVTATVAASVVYGVVSTTREATRARLAEAEAQRSAAELLVQDAQAAARVGDTYRARRATIQSLNTHDSPQARGLWMYLSGAPEPALLSSQTLPKCARWFILAVDDVVLCRASQGVLQGWTGGTKIWELAQDHVELRADADRLYVLDSQRTLFVVDVHTGSVVERDERPGLFVHPQHHERMALLGDAWIDHPDWAMPDCAFGLLESVFDAKSRWHLCKSGEVYRETAGELALVQVFSDVPNLLTLAIDGSLWGGTRHGTIRRVDATSRTLELGESLERIDAVPGSELLLAVGRKSALRLFDPRTLQWVASYPRPRWFAQHRTGSGCSGKAAWKSGRCPPQPFGGTEATTVWRSPRGLGTASVSPRSMVAATTTNSGHAPASHCPPSSSPHRLEKPFSPRPPASFLRLGRAAMGFGA